MQRYRASLRPSLTKVVSVTNLGELGAEFIKFRCLDQLHNFPLGTGVLRADLRPKTTPQPNQIFATCFATLRLSVGPSIGQTEPRYEIHPSFHTSTVLVMNGGISEPQTRRSCRKPSKASQEKQLHAVASTGVEIPQSHQEQFPLNGDLSRDATPVQARKRQLDETFESDSSPAKRARLTRDAQQPGAEDEKAEQADKPTTLQQPKPKLPTYPYASFLRDFVEPVPPNRPESVHTFVSEWLESVGSDREKRCRSDSHLRRSNSPVPRQLTRSAPEMAYTRDADGFMVPQTPASIGPRSYRADVDTGSIAPSDITGSTRGSGRSSGRSLVEDPFYRDENLAANGIYMRSPYEDFPEHIASLVDEVRKKRDSPGPSPDQLRQDTELLALEMGAGEPDVEKYFHAHIFPDPTWLDSLKRSNRQPMAKHTVPSTGSRLKVSTPVPDMLYGYNRHRAFPRQQCQLISMGNEMNGAANNQGLMYPFFVIEFKGDGPSGSGSLWVATNQCLGGSSSCVNVAERLNRQLRHCKNDKIRPIDSAAFSVAMSGTEARLYISWKQNELDYYEARVDSFLLQKPKDYIEFRKYVRNIIDWGKDKRLNEIRDALTTLLEESRKKASEVAKSRQPPSDDSATSSGKRHKSSSSRRNSSRSDSAQGQSREEDKPYWEWDETARQWFHTNADGTVDWAEQEGQPSSVASAE
ncbi:hypothetical protein MKZ38_004020 [Zalerion maritima]|uniref:DUF7924 domain-containing protein n=1 Tax=Zalerion maritima TaxID=339359 RepID=A0AAD5RN34_9PEZI|nr:hypothetical protein MKZ38_004020 [Zalerion maritima]